MTLLEMYKNTLLTAIDDYVKKEGDQTTSQAKAILDIKEFIRSQNTAIDLFLGITEEVKNLPKKSLSFLFFVNDLPKTIKRIIENPQFSQTRIMMDDIRVLGKENRRLNDENVLIKQQLEVFKVSGLDKSTREAMQSIKEENIKLNGELTKVKEQHKQEVALITTEKTQLEGAVLSLTSENEELQRRVLQMQLEKDEMAKNTLQKVQENTELKVEINQLKSEIEIYKENYIGEKETKNNSYRRIPSSC